MAGILSLPEKNLTAQVENFRIDQDAHNSTSYFKDAGIGSLPERKANSGIIESQKGQAVRENKLPDHTDISGRMFARLPRELRNAIYEELLHEVSTTFLMDDLKALSRARTTLNVRKIHPHGPVFQHHYFHTTCVGVEFVKELMDMYLRKASLQVRAHHLVGILHSKYGFANDYFGIGRPLRELLKHVEFDLNQTPSPHILVPLLELNKLDCILELSIPTSWNRGNNNDSYGREFKLSVPKHEVLDELGSTLRMLRGQGHIVRVRYLGTIISTANEQEEFKWCGPVE
ncbi:hypothetical protein BKA66DRAFT_574426 [Pyrenochaeta sp. MPI-SDFR-AT-0127]|nr:hypothetical protein BKA66DRAFT_574426 [Pyrenochaeta sp. MPI-SDFR-AT-0127]